MSRRVIVQSSHTHAMGRALVMSTNYRNEKSLRQLAGQIATGSAEERARTAMVFDNRRAGQLFHRIIE